MFELFNKNLSWLNIRNGLISMNIANADKPNYRPIDIQEHPFFIEKNKNDFHMKKSHIRHMDINSDKNEDDFTVNYQKGYLGKTYSNNSSSIEEQMQKLNDIAMRYNKTVVMYKAFKNMKSKVLEIGK